MPEILEVESARALIEARALHRPIAQVHAPDAWFLKRGLTSRAARAALVGNELTHARRRGKLMLIDTQQAGSVPERRGCVLGLHLGMSGRVLIDGEAAGDPLLYASNRPDAAWHRFGVLFADGGSLYLRDPRRLGAVELDPDEDRLGPDAFALTLAELRAATARSRAPIKALLMDQARIAGLGNLLCDEVLWRAGVDPVRPANTLGPDETRRVHRAIRDTLRIPRPPRRFAHRRPHLAARAGRPLPEGRRTAAPPHRRRAHHLLLPPPPGVGAPPPPRPPPKLRRSATPCAIQRRSFGEGFGRGVGNGLLPGAGMGQNGGSCEPSPTSSS